MHYYLVYLNLQDLNETGVQMGLQGGESSLNAHFYVLKVQYCRPSSLVSFSQSLKALREQACARVCVCRCVSMCLSVRVLRTGRVFAEGEAEKLIEHMNQYTHCSGSHKAQSHWLLLLNVCV